MGLKINFGLLNYTVQLVSSKDHSELVQWNISVFRRADLNDIIEAFYFRRHYLEQQLGYHVCVEFAEFFEFEGRNSQCNPFNEGGCDFEVNCTGLHFRRFTLFYEIHFIAL